MPTTEMTIQFVNAAKTGKKYGSVKTAEGTKFVAKPAVLATIGPGMVCKGTYHVETWGQDQVQILDSVEGGGGGVAKPVPVPSPVRASTSPKDSKQIFVTALLKSFIEAGKLEPSRAGIATLGNAIKSAYEDLFGDPIDKHVKPNGNQDMDDQIPFERYSK